WGVAAGVAMLVFGVVVAVQPAVGIATFVLFLGWYMIVMGIGLVVLAVTMRAAAKRTDSPAHCPTEYRQGRPGQRPGRPCAVVSSPSALLRRLRRRSGRGP